MITGYIVRFTDAEGQSAIYGDGRKAYLYMDEISAKVAAERVEEHGYSAKVTFVAMHMADDYM